VARANIDRDARYARWYKLLKQEIEVVAKPGASFVAVGKVVERELRRLGFAEPFTTVLHYSGQAAWARKAAIDGQEAEFRSFAKSVSLQDILETVKWLLSENDSPTELTQEAIERVRRVKFTESRKMLLFSYRKAFTPNPKP